MASVEVDIRGAIMGAFEGCYEAPRAAALSGVPASTVYDWARKSVVVPSISSVREMRWSYADLMSLRIVYWLRHPKEHRTTTYLPSPMPEVRRALQQLEVLGLDLWSLSSSSGNDRTPLLVERTGKIVIDVGDSGSHLTSSGQGQLDVLDVLGPFETGQTKGPDLIRPRPHLRIVPGKVSGEPHLVHSRLTTLSVAALADRGYDSTKIASLYPEENRDALAEAVDLEQTLAANARAAA